MTAEGVGMRFDEVVIDSGNEEHVTAHDISVQEIVQVFANNPTVRRNRKHRAAEYVADGVLRRRVRSPGVLRLRERGGASNHRMEEVMARRSAAETAAAAEDLYASRDDEDLLSGEVVEVEPRTGPVSTVVSVRLNDDDLRLLEDAAAQAGKKLSTFVREAALAAALSPAERDVLRAVVSDALDSVRVRIDEIQSAVLNNPVVRVTKSEARKSKSAVTGVYKVVDKGTTKSRTGRSSATRVAGEKSHKSS
jgi:uncharacterized protein (DUF1778 family)